MKKAKKCKKCSKLLAERNKSGFCSYHQSLNWKNKQNKKS